MERESRDVVLDLLGEGVCQAGESAHGHPHGEVLPLDIAGADMVGIGVADLGFLLRADARRRAVAHVGSAFVHLAAVEFHQDPVVDVFLKRSLDRVQVEPVAIRCQLDAIRHPAREIVNKVPGRNPVAVTNRPGTDQLGIRVHRNLSPSVSSVGVRLPKFRRHIGLLGGHKRPDFIALNSLAG